MSDGEPGAAAVSGGGNPLAAWCRFIERRLAKAAAESIELVAENDRLRARTDELAAILRAIQQAYLLGRLRAAGKLPAGLFPAGTGTAPAPASAGATDPSQEPTKLYEDGVAE